MRVIGSLLLAITALSATDTWNKVRELKSGTELRIYKKNSNQPVVAKMDEADDERIVVVLKDEQVAIPKADIDRLDARPLKRVSRLTTETKTNNAPNTDARQGNATTPYQHAGPDHSVSSNVSLGSKPAFETIYRRSPAAMAKPESQ